MAISWQDFFRPDETSSGRELKKFLASEGLDIGHRDVLLLRQFADMRFYFSYAVLEMWSTGELERHTLEALLDSGILPRELEDAGLALSPPIENCRLLGYQGEIPSGDSPGGGPMALVPLKQQGSSDSPLLNVYGQGAASLSSNLGAAWTEEKLQKDSLTLLDGESPDELVEAFRHLFRAAPNGEARASVVASALSRHRPELNEEVATKMGEISPDFGRALEQVFTGDEKKTRRALQFLLNKAMAPEPPAWAGFWAGIRPSILKSLSQTESGVHALTHSLESLLAGGHGREFLSPNLVEAFLGGLNETSPLQQSQLLDLVSDWANGSPNAIPFLQSRLSLTEDQTQRLFIGECLRRSLESAGADEELNRLTQLFVEEAISVGSTAGSLALGDLLHSFGTRVLESAEAFGSLSQLTERQALNVLEIWETALQHFPEAQDRVDELYMGALDESEKHWSSLLRCRLLRQKKLKAKFQDWLAACSIEKRQELLSVAYSWSLTVENREMLAQALSQTEWDFHLLWNSEWRRPHLSYQRLGWLAQCAPSEGAKFGDSIADRIREVLEDPPTHLYFWHLFRVCCRFPDFPDELRSQLLGGASQTFAQLEPHQSDERNALFEVAASALRHLADGPLVEVEWTEQLKSGTREELWWIYGVLKALYESSESAPEPKREMVSALIHRLMDSQEQSMQDLLQQALLGEETGTENSRISSGGLNLELSTLCYETLASIASHKACSPILRETVRRRLVIFLISWLKELRETSDPYSFRETPLFGTMRCYLEIENDQLVVLLEELAELGLDLHRKVPDRLRLEVRHQAQEFFREWANRYPEKETATAWKRALDSLAKQAF